MRRHIAKVIILLGLTLAACAARTPVEPQGVPTPTEVELPEAVSAAEETLSEMMDVPMVEIKVSSYERVQWRNGCLELAKSGEACTEVITPGWRVVLIAQEKEYIFHTDEEGQQIRRAE